mgnify:CR=1 FL=1
MGKDKGLEKFLKEAEVLFDGNTYKLNIEEKNQIQEALEMAFGTQKKEINERKINYAKNIKLKSEKFS